MYDIVDLERRWRRYSRKRFWKRIGWGIGVLVLIGAPILYTTFRPLHPAPVPHQPAGEGNLSKGENSPRMQKTARMAEEEKALRAVKPVAVPATPPRSKKPKMTISFSDRDNESAHGGEAPAEKKIRLEVSDTKNARVVKEIEARFLTTRDYDDAMYLAKYYYGKKKYRKAAYWAMQANTIDSSKEGSWLVFGKAKAKQGRRADALRILQSYYDRSGSTRVKDLIDRIRKGRRY